MELNGIFGIKLDILISIGYLESNGILELNLEQTDNILFFLPCILIQLCNV